MNEQTIKRYLPGGDIFSELESRFTRNGALLIAQAAQTGDRFAVNDAMTRAKYGERLPEATALLLWKQLTTDPLGAPLDSANEFVGTLTTNTAVAFLRNPWVLAVLALVGLALWTHYLGWPRMLRIK